jgi:hypothetical protein
VQINVTILTKQIDNFTITDTTDKVVVDYNKSLKDWFDTIITLTIGLFLSVATYFFLEQGIKTKSYIVIASGLIFGFQGVLQTVSGVSRLFQPAKGLLIIDKTAKQLSLRLPFFSSKTISLNDIEGLIVNGQEEKISLGSKNKMKRTYCTVNVKLKDNSVEKLFTINTNRFLRPSNQKLETELYSKAKRLTTELNIHLKSKFKWTGFNEVVS